MHVRDLMLTSSLSVDVNTVAGHGRTGIWTKAAEVLTTEGAIVSVPGVGSGAKSVQSYSGHRPHLV